MDFIDLKAQQLRIKSEIDLGIEKVLSHGRYILGPEVQELEEKLAVFCQTKHAIACANGTDALSLALMAYEIGEGDVVFCPSFTFCATAESVALTGATPFFVDIDRETYNLCPKSLRAAVEEVVQRGELTARAIIAVDLFGQSADYEGLSAIAHEFGLKLISDSAQGFGTTLNGYHPTHWADIATTSFFPAKPLGAYGDGGALFTNDETLTDLLRSLHVHGKGRSNYDNVRIGLNSRLDSLQAAILLPKLAIFSDEISKRNDVADRYTVGLKEHVSRVPTVKQGVVSTWAQYTIEVEKPDALSDNLKASGIPSARYYPTPIHMQTAYRHYPVASAGLPATEDCIGKVISLPMHPYLDEDSQDKVIESVKAAIKA